MTEESNNKRRQVRQIIQRCGFEDDEDAYSSVDQILRIFHNRQGHESKSAAALQSKKRKVLTVSSKKLKVVPPMDDNYQPFGKSMNLKSAKGGKQASSISSDHQKN
jgi:hypothetical protein